MKPIKKYVMFGTILVVLIFLIAFFGDGFLYFLATSDEKVFGDDNRFIDATLTGDALYADSNIKDSYKFNKETNNWLKIILKFVLIVLGVIFILALPLMIWKLVEDKDTSLLEYITNLFEKG